jgi:DNA-binding transcriptional MerR regulator
MIELLTEEEAAKELRVSPQTLAYWRHKRFEPRPQVTRVGRRPMYRRDLLEAYLEAQTQQADEAAQTPALRSARGR